MIEEIGKNIDWLEKNCKSPNILSIAVVLDSLSIQSLRLGVMKADAFDLMSDAEDDYKNAVNRYIVDHQGPVARLERLAEVEAAELKRHWTETKKVYNRYNTWLGRIDVVLDAHRQRVSVEKQGLKHGV